MASRRSDNKDDNFYKRVIHRSHQRILEDLEPLSILDLFLETEYIPYTQVRDIQELRLSSEKTREIVKKVSSKGAEGYRRFKILLRRSQQEHLIDTLNEQELALEREIKMAQRHQELEILRVPNDIELYSIAAHIGLNWEMLGPFLGIPTTTIDQIKLDNSSTIQKIYRMLFVWRAMNGREATLQKLLSQMQNAPGAVNIDWHPLKEDIAKFDTINRTSSATATVGAGPNTTENSQQQMLYEREAADRMRQLRIEQPIGNQGSLDQSAGSGFEIAKHNDDSYRASQRPQTLTSLDPSVGELGNTRRQGQFQSNVIGPDVSGKSFNSLNRPDGPPNKHTQVSNQAVSVDQTDAVRMRSLEQNKPSVNPDALNTVATTPAELQAVASVSSSTVQKVAGEPANTVLQTFGTSKAITSLDLSEKLKSSLDTFKEGIGKFEEALGQTKEDVRENTFLPGPAFIAPEHPRNTSMKQGDQDSVDGMEDRAKRLKKIFDSEENMKGRLKVLTAENIDDLLKSSTHKSELKGGFGDIYVSNEKIPGLDLRVVVKKVDLKVNEATQKMRSLTSEKLCARTMHFAIVPLLGIREDSDNRIYYFLSPYMENGNLNQAIEEDNKRLARDIGPVLNVSRRIKIMYQIASAIDFLHTPVKDKIRGMILHMDIKSLNIVLDKAYNARLIDFGLAREMKAGHDHTKTTSHYYATAGYGKLTEQQIRAKHDDYRYFGVVIREILTGKKPSVEGRQDEDLINQTSMEIEIILLEMWEKLELEPSVSNSLIELSTDCIEKKKLTSEKIVEELTRIAASTNTQRWDNDSVASKNSKKCDICLEYNAVEERIFAHSRCENHINICVSCMRNSYCNPIRCHSCDDVDTTIHPTIGHGWAALLVAGDDKRDSVAKSMKTDVDAMHKVITSKWPLVMGVSDDRVKVLYPEDNMKEKLQKAVKALQTWKDNHTLLVYISSHYKPDEGGFELRSGKAFLSIGELQKYVADIFHENTSTKRAIVFLDCCSAPAITVAVSPTNGQKQNSTVPAEPNETGDTNTLCTNEIKTELILRVPNISIMQINACRPGQSSVLEPGGSLFRKFLLQGLTGNALGEPCINCAKCPLRFCKMDGDFVTVGDLHVYISKHLKSSKALNQGDCVLNVYNADSIDVKIGYAINFKVDLQFTFDFNGEKAHDVISQRMFRDLSELQTVLFDKYTEKMGVVKPNEDESKLRNEYFREILCIEVEKGPKKRHRDRLDSLEKIMTAWNSKLELVVSLRTLPEITEGMVAVFLKEENGVEPITEFLEKSNFVKKEEEDCVTMFIIQQGPEAFVEMIKDVKKVKGSNSSMQKFYGHLARLDSAIKKSQVAGSLHIVFPCAKVDGARKHRKDFICYQLKKGDN